MAEAERIIGTPDTPGSPGAEPEQPRTGDTSRPSRPGGADTGADATGCVEGHARPDARPRPAPEGEQATQGERGGGDPASGRGPRRIAVLFVVAALAYLLDLVSKAIVVAKLEHHDSVELIGDWLRLEAIRNSGAAFSMGQAYTVIFTVIACAVIFVIIRLARKLYSVPWAVALGLLLGGALGNLTDRLFRSPGVFRGAVVDFIAPKNFAVFNLADSAIVCGGVLIVLLSFRGLDPDGTVHRD